MPKFTNKRGYRETEYRMMQPHIDRGYDRYGLYNFHWPEKCQYSHAPYFMVERLLERTRYNISRRCKFCSGYGEIPYGEDLESTATCPKCKGSGNEPRPGPVKSELRRSRRGNPFRGHNRRKALQMHKFSLAMERMHDQKMAIAFHKGAYPFEDTKRVIPPAQDNSDRVPPLPNHLRHKSDLESAIDRINHQHRLAQYENRQLENTDPAKKSENWKYIQRQQLKSEVRREKMERAGKAPFYIIAYGKIFWSREAFFRYAERAPRIVGDYATACSSILFFEPPAPCDRVPARFRNK